MDGIIGTQIPAPDIEGLNDHDATGDGYEPQRDSVEQQAQAVSNHGYQDDDEEGFTHEAHNDHEEIMEEEFISHDQDTPVASVEQYDAAETTRHDTSEQAPHIHENDSTSLFISENSPPSPVIAPRQDSIVPMAPPACPAPPRKKMPGLSVFGAIKKMQKRRQEQKLVASRQASTYQTTANLDNEAYLEAVMLGQPSSTAVPAIDQDDFADKQAARDYEKQKRHYDEIKRKNGTLSFKQDVEWMKIRGAETARKRKRLRDIEKAREENEDEPDLFLEFHLPTNNEQEEESDNDFCFEDSEPRKRRRPMPTKEEKQMTIQDAEMQSMRVALEAEGDLPRKKKKRDAAGDDVQGSATSGRGKDSKGKSIGKPRKPRSGPKKPTKSRGGKSSRKEVVEHAVKQATSLFNADVFQQQAGANAAEQPTFRSRVKADALKELIASVPLDDQKKARGDMAMLLAATKDFDGKGSVKADGCGLWKVTGMSTSLKPYQVLGTAFMRRRENATEEPRGGLMADQMGLGKTLMMLGMCIKKTCSNRTDSYSEHG